MPPRKRPKKVYVGIRLTEPMVKKIDAMAERDGVSRGEMIRQMLMRR